ncbi:Hypothetical protein I595_2136 [Croceitalea dokdonensis DOKDO 023]|uniref:Uncharacterized protein n=1 Tax=Croceitalea dokdonensis DOKDO 023 TaxID=1300341 RepID=A0A0P7ATA1_9FLAO|nr:DUF6686 family protein [Croceitalea dokdonensis]KPM31642.1 Hypothetical protein I595_2136 [Croceitalea dokdonensis DOKDO 023]
MAHEVYPIYSNNFGVAFSYCRTSNSNPKKIQIVFRDTGLLLTTEELYRFALLVRNVLLKYRNDGYCRASDGCKKLLLDTPAHQITLAVNYYEIEAIDDLIQGTLFQLNLDDYLENTLN